MREHLDDNQQRQRAFFLTGRCEGPMLEPLTGKYKPALLARYNDLTSLRYDFPLVLNENGPGDRAVLSLSSLVDEAVAGSDDGSHRDRLAKHGHRIEQEIRRELQTQGCVDFGLIWEAAAERLAAHDEGIKASGETLWKAFDVSGRLVDLDPDLPCRVVSHVWRLVEGQKAADFAAKSERLLFRLREILSAEETGSAAGRAPERLRAGVGTAFSNAFDFDSLSNILAQARPDSKLTDRRRQRIQQVIGILEDQRFYPVSKGQPCYEFRFQTCSDALAAYNDRYNDAVNLLGALAIAELEVKGEYREQVHDVIFDDFGRSGVSADQMAKLPDYIICTNTADLDAAETAEIIDILAAGRPFRILVATDDVLERSKVGAAHTPIAFRSRQLVDTAIGLSDVFVYQASASDLYRSREGLMRAASFDGAVLFSVFSGVNDFTRGVSPYLVAAAASECRAFPALIYDPSAGDELKDRLDIGCNALPSDDWPVHPFVFEDADLQAHSLELCFTLADLMALDQRFYRHFAVLPDAKWDDPWLHVPAALDADLHGTHPELPAVPLVDQDGRLHRALVDEQILDVVRRSRTIWRLLREQGLRHAEPAAERVEDVPPDIVVAEEVEVSESTTSTAPVTAEPYIETARCTTCNECTSINGRMFAYNSNKQAYVADPDAGTYRQLVEAAESCQVSIIHPGKPRNPKEPGLDELIKRAEPFA